MIFASLIHHHPNLGRWLYAGIAGLGAASFTFIFLHRIANSGLSENDRSYELLLPVILAAFLAGLICWPRKNRSLGRMIVAGLCTVAMAFLILGIALTLKDVFQGKAGFEDIERMITAVFGMLVLGSFFTLGIPYIVGVGLSFLFIDTNVSEFDLVD